MERLGEASCITELSQENRRVIREGKEVHTFFNLPCLKSILLFSNFSASPTCYIQSLFLFKFKVGEINLHIGRNILSLTSLSIFVASLFSKPFIVFWPSSIQDEASHVIAFHFRGKNDLGEISFLISYLAFDLNLNEWARPSNKILRSFLIVRHTQVAAGFERRYRKWGKNYIFIYFLRNVPLAWNLASIHIKLI